jgi:hypothetical protein
MVYPVQGKDIKGLGKKYKAALDKLLIEESKLAAGGTSIAADQAYRVAVRAREAAIKAGIKVEDIPDTTTDRLTGNGTKPRKTLTSEQQIKLEMDRASIGDNSGTKQIQAKYPNTANESGEATVLESYLYVEPANLKIRESYTPGSTASQMGIQWGKVDTVRDLYQKQLMKIYGSKEALYNKLYQAGYIKTKKISPTTGTRDILDALQTAVADYSIAQTNDYKNGKIKGDFPTMDAFLSSGNRNSKSLTQTTRTAVVYDDTRATALIKRLYQTAQGRDPNTKELKELIPMVQDFQKKNPQINTSTENEEGTFSSGINKQAGDPEEFLIEKLSQKNETKARSILGYYDAFKSVIGVQ